MSNVNEKWDSLIGRTLIKFDDLKEISSNRLLLNLYLIPCLGVLVNLASVFTSLEFGTMNIR